MPAATRAPSARPAAQPRHGASRPTLARCPSSVGPADDVRADGCSPQPGRLYPRASALCKGQDEP
eukprot:4868309-Alexandrium_andersonii.AAC.1